MFILNGHSWPLFVLFSSISHHNFRKHWIKRRCCAWNSNPAPQNGRHRRIHWAIVAANWSVYVNYVGMFVSPMLRVFSFLLLQCYYANGLFFHLRLLCLCFIPLNLNVCVSSIKWFMSNACYVCFSFIKMQKLGGSAGLVVKEEDSRMKGHGSKSWRCILDGHFFTFICWKIVLFVWKDRK